MCPLPKWETHYRPHSCNKVLQRFFFALKMKKCQLKISNIFSIFAQNIDCGYMLERPHQGVSNMYPQSMFWSKNKKTLYTPVLICKMGFKGVYITRPCFFFFFFDDKAFYQLALRHK